MPELSFEDKFRKLPPSVRYSLRNSDLTTLKASASTTMSEGEVDKWLTANAITGVDRMETKLALQAEGLMVCGRAARISG